MKYKVGDKVRIRELKALERVCQKDDIFLWFKNYDITFNSAGMNKYCGEIATIVDVNEGYYHLDIDNKECKWQDWMFEGYAFEFGEEIEVSDGDWPWPNEKWEKTIYVGYIDGQSYPYICVLSSHKKNFKLGKEYLTRNWRYARPIQKKHTIIIDNKEIEISEESYQKLKESLK